jgi:hypothetical protein
MTRISALSASVLSLALTAGLLLTTNQASAQEKASVTVPFAFSANHQQVPAGSYEVKMASERFLSLRNKQTNQTQTILVRPETGSVTESRGRLVFRRQGGQTQLMQVWVAGTCVHSELPGRKKHQRGLEIAQANTTFEVQMK